MTVYEYAGKSPNCLTANLLTADAEFCQFWKYLDRRDPTDISQSPGRMLSGEGQDIHRTWKD